jgi:hypothetical protein
MAEERPMERGRRLKKSLPPKPNFRERYQDLIVCINPKYLILNP